MKKITIYFIEFYQKFISPLKKPCCRFTPTCSEYAMKAIERFGFFKGLWLSSIRIIRCTPLSRGGYDPVPQKK